MNYHKMA